MTCRGQSYAEPPGPQDAKDPAQTRGWQQQRGSGSGDLVCAVVRQLISWVEIVDQVEARAPKVGSR